MIYENTFSFTFGHGPSFLPDKLRFGKFFCHDDDDNGGINNGASGSTLTGRPFTASGSGR